MSEGLQMYVKRNFSTEIFPTVQYLYTFYLFTTRTKHVTKKHSIKGLRESGGGREQDK